MGLWATQAVPVAEDADRSADEGLARWRHRAVVAWALVGMAAVFVLAVMGLAQVGQAVELLLVGIVVGFVCSPITNSLEDAHVPRALAALIALVVVVAVLAGAAALVLGPCLQQLMALLRNVPSYAEQVQAGMAEFWASHGTGGNAEVQQVSDAVLAAVSSAGTGYAQDLAKQITSGMVSNVVDMVNHVVTFFLALVLGYWLAKDYPVICRELAAVAGPRHERSLVLLMAVASRSMGGYMRGALITSVVNGVLAFVGLALCGHQYAWLVAMVTFFMHFVPVIGPLVSAVAAVALALFSGLPLAVWSLVVMVVAQNLTDNLLSPLVMRSAVKVHPVLSLVGIVIGGALGGVWGMVLAIPAVAALRGVFVYFYESRTGRQLVSPEGALFQSGAFRDGAGRVEPALDALDDESFFEGSRLVPPGGWGE